MSSGSDELGSNNSVNLASWGRRNRKVLVDEEDTSLLFSGSEGVVCRSGAKKRHESTRIPSLLARKYDPPIFQACSLL